MQWSAHGRFELHWEDDCLSLSLDGEWNEVTAQRMAARVRQLVAERAGRPWALLSDARDWEGATPAAMQIVWQMFVPLRDQGMVAATTVLPRGFQEVVIRPLMRQARTMTRYRPFQQRAEAKDWLLLQLAESAALRRSAAPAS